ncbi:WD40-repeat-containing domain protein [Mycotypha africana]|uniref:WD40-repeat-containing domain protein n=1 Tax=Mycotypha africana TaxID=64632 RepID=UPI0023006E4F|nr:WD40-repeat-containing domain protein [Mycotypha africana]KAI8969149.1 WD40-repeat-containing domain protein [Mycotypha africana]
MSVKELPFVSVQADWNKVVEECSSKTAGDSHSFWLDCYLTGHETVHGKVDIIVSDGKEAELKGKEGIDVKAINSRSFILECDKMNLKDVLVFSPRKEINVRNGSLTTSVSCVDISPNGKLFVAGCGEQAFLGSMDTGEVQVTLNGHLSDVTTVRFFPSNLVVLTGGADFQLKIWSAINGSNPVTLKGHTGAITGLAIISKGRNVLSCSRDGTIKLWNCGTSSVINTMGNYKVPINKMLLAKLPREYTPASVEDLDPLEVETADKFVLVALEDGSAHCIHLGTKQELSASHPKNKTPLTAIAYDSISNMVATGNKDGIVEVFESLNSLDKPVLQWKRKAFAITSLAFKKNDDNIVLCVSSADGSMYQTGPINGSSNDDVYVRAEFSGSELETIHEMKVYNDAGSEQNMDKVQRIVCAVRDGKLKFY